MRPQVKDTSIQAYREEEGNIKGRRSHVLAALKTITAPVTGREVEDYTGIPGAWKRLPELERMGLAYRAGKKTCAITGKTATSWWAE